MLRDAPAIKHGVLDKHNICNNMGDITDIQTKANKLTRSKVGGLSNMRMEPSRGASMCIR